MPCPGLGGLRRGYSLWGGGGPPSPPGSVPPWITSGFSWSRVGLAKWFIRMQGSDTSRLACFFKDLQSILWQCFTWKARYCNASLLLSPLSLSPQPYLSSTSRASSHTTTPYPPRILMQTQWNNGGLISPRSKYIVL